VVTFDPHPLEVLAPQKAPCALTTLEQRLGLFEGAGMDMTVVLPFNRELARLTPKEFTQVMLVEDLHVRKVVVGADFRFGHKRAGDIATLQELGREFGFEAEAIDLVGDGSERISSTDIRRLVAAGRVEEAAALLGHPFRLAGVVVPGLGVGRTLHGLATANLEPHQRACIPGLGVYAGRWVWRGRALPGVINVGRERGPGLEAAPRPVVEIHIFDLEEDLVGEHGEIEFSAFIRDEMRFEGKEQLAAQIRRDADEARRLLGT
jgi:riboflavin kinase/FMN adenylyltransferase